MSVVEREHKQQTSRLPYDEFSRFHVTIREPNNYHKHRSSGSQIQRQHRGKADHHRRGRDRQWVSFKKAAIEVADPHSAPCHNLCDHLSVHVSNTLYHCKCLLSHLLSHMPRPSDRQSLPVATLTSPVTEILARHNSYEHCPIKAAECLHEYSCRQLILEG